MNFAHLTTYLSIAFIFTASLQATPTVFTTKAQFLLAITNSGTDSFNNLSIVAFTPGPINRTAGVHSYTSS